MRLQSFTPQVGDHFLNEQGRIFQIIEVLPVDEYRCRRCSEFSSNVTEFERFRLHEIIPEKQGSFWILTTDAMDARLKKAV